MKKIKNFFKKICVRIQTNYYKSIQKKRERYYNKLKRRVKVKTPSIIASNCFGGFMYHHLGMQFLSPTIKLFFDKEDYIVFLEDLNGFLNAELKDVSIDSGKHHPVGELTSNGKTVKINFLHYESFEQAKEKWLERKARIDFDDLRIVWVVVDGLTDNDVKRFEALPFKYKYVITNKNPWKKDFVYVLKYFNKKYYADGQMFYHRKQFHKKKPMDALPYVNWINGEK